MVQRLRLRSTIEPPPRGPVPLPTPKAPESPESLPECINTRNTTITARITWMIESIVSTPRSLAALRASESHSARASSRPKAGTGYTYLVNPAYFGGAGDQEKRCQGDYESFTDSWSSADMTPGGR